MQRMQEPVQLGTHHPLATFKFDVIIDGPVRAGDEWELSTVASLHLLRPLRTSRWPARAAAALTLAGLIAGTALAQPAEAATKRFVTIAGHMVIHDVDSGMSCDMPFIANRNIVTRRTNFGFTQQCGSIRGELFETVEPRTDAYIQLRGWVRVTDQQPSGERGSVGALRRLRPRRQRRLHESAHLR